MDVGLLSIGRFAHLSGLTLHALRHYDDVDLLKPASVDGNGYRRYSRSQVESAKLIRRLRWLDVPVDEIRQVINVSGNERDALLRRHRQRLERQRDVLAERVVAVDHQLQQGDDMTKPATGCTPVQIKIAVSDFGKARDFYETAFGLKAQVTRRTKDEDIYGFMFGQYEEPGFFLLHMLGEEGDVDMPGRSTFGLLVDDLEVVHRRAVEAGATEMVSPMTPEGMPRCSAVRDLDDNWIWLYQA